MSVYPNSVDTILAVDFGTATTRALLFDVVENTYRMVGCAEAPSTIDPPYREASEGMRLALLDLQLITGRTLLDDTAQLIMPAMSDGRGTDAFVATSSAGPAVRTLVVGLLPDVSLASARRATGGHYLSVVDSFSLGDNRGEDQQIDAVIGARPDLIVIAGGTDNGASEALLKLVETITLACHLLPPDVRSKALFMGNAAVEERIRGVLGNVASVYAAPNVQPELGYERLGPARAELENVYELIRMEQIGGFAQLAQRTGGRILPTAQSAGLFVRFLSKLSTWPRGVLAVDLGSASTFVAAAWDGKLSLTVRPDIGVGLHAAGVLSAGSLEALTRWVPEAVGDDEFREFVLNKSARPHTLPADKSDLYKEQALARHVIRTALGKARPDWPEGLPGPRADLMPWFSLIIGSGAVLGQAPRPGQAALMLLDALQPSGVTRLMLDPYHLAAALGGAAYVNPIAVAQVYDSGAFVDLGTAVSVISTAVRPDPVACVVKLEDAAGAATEVEVKAGSLEVLPLAPNQTGKLSLRPRPGYNVGFGPGRGRSLTVTGGTAGIIIDARGRPISLPRTPEQRYEAVQQWIAKVSEK